ncbi:MAG: hypothetical protein QM652_08705 [Legionella sp.]|uniref:hypothetical protein n=1 Tax=Legionella sp. TaxID=459 RepID=UPI0039E5A7B5
MSPQSEEGSPLNHRELVFILAIARRIEAQGRLQAEQLDKNRTIYEWFNLVDSLSCSCSMLKYAIEVFFPAYNNANTFRDFLISPQGTAIVISEIFFLVTFSFLACRLESDNSAKNDPVKKFIIGAWPYFRDLMKGMKNAYKAWKAAILIFDTLTGIDARSLIIPLGLIIGVLATANRIYIRYFDDVRKKMQSENEKFLAEILAIRSLNTLEKLEAKLEAKLKEKREKQQEIWGMSDEARIHAFLAKGLGGFIDGIYLYGGLVTLAVLTPQAFLTMSVVSGIYTLVCVISRLYEEYDNQLKLTILQTKCELVLVAKKLEITYVDLLYLEKRKESLTADEKQRVLSRRNNIVSLMRRFEELRKELKYQTTDTYLTAALYGLRQGLFTYGVLAGFLFMVTAVCSISTTAFPPIFLMACISSGLAFIIGVSACMMYNHYQHLKNQPKEADESFYHLVVMKDEIEKNINIRLLSNNVFYDALENGKNPKPSPTYSFPKWLEVLRSFFSGISKGNNFALFIGVRLQDRNQQTHEHDVSFMLMLTIFCASVFSFILTARALAKELKPVKDAVIETAVVNPDSKLISAKSEVVKPAVFKQEEPPKTELKAREGETWVCWESSRSKNKSLHGSLPRSSSLLNLFGFGLFSKVPSNLRASEPSFPLQQNVNDDYHRTIQGLV